MTPLTHYKANLSQSESRSDTGEPTVLPDIHVTNLLRSLDLSCRDLDKIQQGHDMWPRWCFAPFTVWAMSFVRSRQDLRKINEMTSAITVIPWRYSRSVYRFDADVYRELVATPFSGEIPEEVLLRLPEWSIFVEMQRESVFGFFSSLEYVSPGKAELRFVFCGAERLIPFYIALSSGTIEKSFEDCLKEYEGGAGESDTDRVKKEYLQLLGEDLLLVKRPCPWFFIFAPTKQRFVIGRPRTGSRAFPVRRSRKARSVSSPLTATASWTWAANLAPCSAKAPFVANRAFRLGAPYARTCAAGIGTASGRGRERKTAICRSSFSSGFRRFLYMDETLDALMRME